jgi:hypothetical protein
VKNRLFCRASAAIEVTWCSPLIWFNMVIFFLRPCRVLIG